VSDAVVLVDRQQGGGALLEAAGLRLHSVMGINDLLDEIRTEALIDQATFVEVKEYLDGSRAN
jgi:orotate phosphoribosyltransferase